MWKKLTSHKRVMYSKFPRIKSFLNKGFFVIGLFRLGNANIYYNGHLVGREMANTGALMIDWNRMKNAGYMEDIVQ